MKDEEAGPVVEEQFSAPSIPLSGTPSEMARREEEAFSKGPQKNTVVLPLWGGGYISFNPADSVSIFAFLALIILIFCILLLAVFSIGSTEAEWRLSLSTALGHAVTAVIGAIVGSAVTKKDD